MKTRSLRREWGKNGIKKWKETSKAHCRQTKKGEVSRNECTVECCRDLCQNADESGPIELGISLFLAI